MSHDRSKPSRRGWRDAVANTPPAVEGKRKWQQTAPAPVKTDPAKRRRFKLAVAATSLTVLVGLLAWILFWPRPPRSACLVLLGAGYEDNLALPHNAAGWNGLQGLRQLALESGTVSSWLPWLAGKDLRLQFGPKAVAADADFDADILAKAFANVAEKTVIVHVSLHGGADAKGPYLFADDPTARKRVYVKALLERLKAPELQDKNKVLLLDCGLVESHWPSGMLHNDFARELKRLEGEIKKTPNLIVISANDVDQRSWVSEEWQRTIFTHYVIEGLRGAADADGTERVTAWELYQYVKDRVSAWADHNRDAPQTPILLGDEQAARNIELAQVEEGYKGEQPFTAAPGLGDRGEDVRGALRAAWERWRELQESVPHPAVYSPNAWRSYQDALLRYEELLRLGDPTGKKKNLQDRLGKLEATIRQARELLPAASSLGNALPMPAVHGAAPAWPENELLRHFDALRKAKDIGERAKAWEKLAEWLKGQEPGNEKQRQQLLETRLGGLALQPLAAKDRASAAELRQAAELLHWVNGRTGNLRPAEAHFLIMLFYEKIAPPKLAPDPLLHLALRVRLLAEEAALGTPPAGRGVHLYSEAVFPWVRAKVAAADRKRHDGEDWLFGSTKESWQEGEKLLRAAEKIYRAALDDAAAVREALHTRDRALALLPYYARWAAGQWLSDATKERRERVQGWMALVEQAGKDADALCARLHKPSIDGDGLHAPLARQDGLDPRPLRQLANDVRLTLEQLRKAFDRECDELRDVQQQGRWHDLQAVLATPLLDDLDLRLLLAANAKSISNKLHEGGLQRAAAAADRDKLARLARERAQREGLMALAVAGEPWSGAFARPQVRQSIVEATDEGWRETLRQAGKYIREHGAARLEAVKQGWSKSLDEGDLDKAAGALRPAEHFCRFVLSDAAPDIPAVPFDPVQAARRLRFHDFLCWQAERAEQDHWFLDSDNPRATYYVPAAAALLKDAQRLAEARADTVALNKSRQKHARGLQEAIALARLTATPSAQALQHLTGDQRFDLSWSFTADKGVPPGVPMVWLELKEDAPGTLAKIDAADYVERQPLVRAPEWLPKAKTYALTTRLRDPSKPHPLVPRAVSGQARLRGVYRGQRIDAPVDLRVYDSADIIFTRYPPPSDPEVRLTLAPGVNYGALCIVIDFSGSMHNPLGKGETTRRIDHVRAALQEVLPKIPEGTHVSVLIFGHKTGPNNQEESFAQTKLKWVRPPQRWSPRATKRLIEDLFEAETPMNYTPIAESLLIAKEEGFPAGYKGPRVILALTDGQDTMFDRPEKEHLRRRFQTDDIRAFVKRVFSDSDIEVNVLVFTKDQKEKDQAKAQFDVVEKLEPQGTFYWVEDSRELVPTLVAALLPQLTFHDGSKRVALYERGAPQRDNSLPATPLGKNDIWRSLKVGEGEGDVLTARLRNLLSRDVRLRRGEKLLLQVDQGPRNTLVLERLLFADVVEKGQSGRRNFVRPSHSGRWLTAVLQNRITEEEAKLTHLITIENAADRRPEKGAILQHTYPGCAWLEVAGRDGKAAKGLRWHREYGYPAPAFRAHAAEFKNSDEPKVTLWFGENPTPVAPVAQRFFLTDVKLGQEVSVGKARFTIERIESDDRYVTVTEGQRRQKRCFIVQIQYDPARPVWVQAASASPQGEEHHFYTRAGKYVALFWGGADPAQLNIVSLSDFKEQAQRIEWDLPNPDPRDTGPSLEKLGS